MLLLLATPPPLARILLPLVIPPRAIRPLLIPPSPLLRVVAAPPVAIAPLLITPLLLTPIAPLPLTPIARWSGLGLGLG